MFRFPSLLVLQYLIAHCTTAAPTWLDLQGQHLPAEGQEIEGRACSTFSNCCEYHSPITVRNCGSYYVYKLQPQNTCYHAICLELQA
ncbi:hypothetical protein ACOMHN_001553 [Nucella lapillus]